MNFKENLFPVLAFLIGLVLAQTDNEWLSLLVLLPLIYCALQAVHHAEHIAKKIGEPLGTLVLAVAVTCIELSLIISVMLKQGSDAATLPRDTVFASVMIILNLMVGLSVFSGSIRHKYQTFIKDGALTAVSTLFVITFLTLILPNFTISEPGPFYSHKQLAFVGSITFAIYLLFLYFQNVGYKDLFIKAENKVEHHVTSSKGMGYSLVWLFINLGVVIYLAEILAHPIEFMVEHFQLPHSVVGILIALIVLLPESLSAILAARKNNLQKSLNLSLGSALATVGLTLPVLSFISLVSGWELALGLETVYTLLLFVSFLLVMQILQTEKSNLFGGILLIMLFSVYLFITIFN